MPMTILWALENLKADDPWTKKEYPCTFPDLIVPALLIEKTIHTQLIGALGKEMVNGVSLKKFYTVFQK